MYLMTPFEEKNCNSYQNLKFAMLNILFIFLEELITFYKKCFPGQLKVMPFFNKRLI